MTNSERVYELVKMRRMLGMDTVDYLVSNGFVDAPASTRFHGAYEGGLFDHSVQVLKRLLKMSKHNQIKFERTKSPYIIAILHDLCKIDQYEKYIDEQGEVKFRYAQTEVKGHGEKSVIYAKRLLTLTEEEEMCIRYHMGAFTDSSEWSSYTDAVHRYQNVLWVHTADMAASHIDMI